MDNIQPAAIVTGAGSGIGRAVAIALGREGVNLVLVGRRPESLEETAQMVGDNCETIVLPADVSDPSSGSAMVSACVGRFGRLDVLINNAGTAPLLPIERTTPEVIEEVYMTNAVGPACAIAAAWTVFKKQAQEKRMSALGHCIVNVSTLGTSDPFPGFFAYASSKASMNLMAKICSKEGAEIGVRAFAVAPGAVETPMLRAIFGTDQVPSSNCLTSSEVAEEVLACVTGEREAMNGQTIFLKK